jgi:hypothetical protein
VRDVPVDPPFTQSAISIDLIAEREARWSKLEDELCLGKRRSQDDVIVVFPDSGKVMKKVDQD